MKVENKANLVTTPQPRPRVRQVSWGPPPIAILNATQLPFKIEENPSTSPTAKTATTTTKGLLSHNL